MLDQVQKVEIVEKNQDIVDKVNQDKNNQEVAYKKYIFKKVVIKND